MLRHQLPVHSPLDLGALLSGAAAALSRESGEEARERVRSRLRERFSAGGVLLTDSGTSALALALEGAAERREGPAALPAYGCYDLATAADAADVEVVLYDLEPGTLSPNPDSLRETLETGASSLVAAPLYGVPQDMDALRDVAEQAGALFIEDSAQGAGACWNDRALGSHGDVSVLSFGRGKGITGGGGGALLAPTGEATNFVAQSGSRLRRGGAGWGALARTLAQWALGRPRLYGIPASLPFLSLGETVYREPQPPTGLPASCAGVLTRTLDLEAGESERRRAHAGRLRTAVETASDVRNVELPDEARPGWLRLPVLADSDEARVRLSSERSRRLGIMPGYPKTLSRLSGFRVRCRNARSVFHGSEELASSLFTLPTHGLLTRPDMDEISGIVENAGPGKSTNSSRPGAGHLGKPDAR